LDSEEEECDLPESYGRVELAFHMLPFASMKVQSEGARAKISGIGVERKKQVLRFARELEENLNLVPEAIPSRSKLLAYIDGSDPDHFGDVFSEILKAWASSSSDDQVKLSLQMHLRSLKRMMKFLFCDMKKRWCCLKGKGKNKGKGKGKWLSLLAHKGHGKGNGFDVSVHGGADMPAADSASFVDKGPEEEEHLPDWNRMPEWAFHMLPFAAMKVQSECARAKISAIGVDRREEVLLFALKLEDNLDMVPDASSSRAKLLAFIDGSDPDHFGDVFADVLQAWSSSSSTEQVKLSLEMHFCSIKKMLKLLFCGAGKGKGKCWKGCWKGKGMKGKGKGFEPSSCGQSHSVGDDAGCSSKGFLGGILHASWKGMLSSLKGLGKGKGFILGGAQEHAINGGVDPTPADASSSGNDAHDVATQSAPQGSPQSSSNSDTAPICESTQACDEPLVDKSSAIFDEQIKQLLEMNLVSSPMVARELLTEHNGCVSKVVSVLIG